MSIIHLRQIESKLSSLFTGLIDMDDWNNKSSLDREIAFLSRSLAAFSIFAAADTSPEQAAASITDGYNDNGIDAVYFDGREKTLYMVQTKWKKDGTGSIERGDNLKFIRGIKDLINVEFDRFNDKIKVRAKEIEDALYQVNMKIVIILAYTGQANISKEISRDFDDLLKEINDPSDVMSLKILKQGDLYSFIASGSLGLPLNLMLL